MTPEDNPPDDTDSTEATQQDQEQEVTEDTVDPVTTSSNETTVSPADVRAAAPTIVGATLAFGALLVLRINTSPSVLRGGNVISPLNDPYYFRFWMEQLVTAGDGPADASILSATGGPGTNGQAFDAVRPAAHALNWWLAELTGPDLVTTWLPVLSSLVVGVSVLAIGYGITRDLRVGFASVGMLALSPLHAVYSGLGFLDHTVHQYLWLGVTLAGLVWLAQFTAQRYENHHRTENYLTAPALWSVVTLTGFSVGVYVHTFGGSPLFIIPLFLYIAFRVPMDLRAGLSPGYALAPIVAAVSVGALVAAGFHFLLDWGELFVVLTPIYAALGSGTVLVIGAVWRRLSLPVVGLAPVEGVAALVGVWLVTHINATAIERYRARSGSFLGRENIAEAVSLFEPNLLGGPLARLGVGFLFAVPVLLWLTNVVARQYRPAWLVIVVYSWTGLGLAFVQNRFAGQLSLLLAVLAGFGLITLLYWLDFVRPVAVSPDLPTSYIETVITDSAVSAPEQPASATASETTITRLESPTTRRDYLGLGGSVAVTGALGVAIVGGQTTQTVYDDDEYQAAQTIMAHQQAVAREYPENFVLSRWGTNRMYNYFTSGESESYGFARDTYPEFLIEETPDEWAQDQLEQVGYVVIDADDADFSVGTAYHMLQERLGVAMEYREPLSHYRLLYLAGDGDSPDDWRLSAFAVVPGVTIRGTGTPGERVTAGTDVSISGIQFPYRQATTVTDNGQFELTVPYPGRYEVSNTEVQISETDVVRGESITVS